MHSSSSSGVPASTATGSGTAGTAASGNAGVIGRGSGGGGGGLAEVGRCRGQAAPQGRSCAAQAQRLVERRAALWGRGPRGLGRMAGAVAVRRMGWRARALWRRSAAAGLDPVHAAPVAWGSGAGITPGVAPTTKGGRRRPPATRSPGAGRGLARPRPGRGAGACQGAAAWPGLGGCGT